MGAAACSCGCTTPQDGGAHVIAAALAGGDVDAALQSGLLASEPCPGCTDACRQALLVARGARRIALAARERFRAREARLARKNEERARRAVPARHAPSAQSTAMPALPPAAAAALARARDKAASGRSR
jgi:hypothetical protein